MEEYVCLFAVDRDITRCALHDIWRCRDILIVFVFIVHLRSICPDRLVQVSKEDDKWG